MISRHTTTTPHYQVREHHGRFAVVYPLPGDRWGGWASLCDFRTRQAAHDHAAWLNTGRSSAAGAAPARHTPRDPDVELLLLGIRQRMGLHLGLTAAQQETPQ
jgi:hypothetical protein